MADATSPVVTQSRGRRPLWSKRVVVALLPVVLAGAVWEVRHLQEPVNVNYSRKSTSSHVLFERLAKGAREHPFAKSISIQGPSDDEPVVTVSCEEGINYLTRSGYLEYGILDSGWSYTHIELSGVELLDRSHLPQHPTTLSPSLDAQLRKKGWIRG